MMHPTTVMKHIRLLSLFAVLLLSLGLVACDSVVDDIEEPIASAGDDGLTNPDQVDFLINGIVARGNNVQDNITVQSSLLSDQFIFGGNVGSGATFPTFRHLMEGLTPDTQPLNNNSVDGTLNNLGQYRFLADDLLERAEAIGAEALGGVDSEDWQRVQFAGNFHGGLARYYWATYFGELPRSGGGVISDLDNPADTERGEFIPSPQMYDLAVQKLDAAADFATDREQRVINSVKARIALLRNDAAAAASLAANGITPEDAPFLNEYIERAGGQRNTWFAQAGPGRTQATASLRFYYGEDYLNQDLENPESSRIPQFDADDVGTIEEGSPFNILDLDNRTSRSPVRFDLGLEPGDSVNLFAQARYIERSSNIRFITWQEMNLIRAEAAERGAASGDPLALINEVRASHGIAPIDPADYNGMNTIFVERDKEMFTTGIRLLDQRRASEFGLDSFGLDLDRHGWHLDNPDTWWYLPITLSERNNNPNLPSELP